MTPSAPPELFDRALMRARARAGKVPGPAARFLADALSRELAERMSPIKRRFGLTLLGGPFSRHVAIGEEFGTAIVEGRDVAFDADALPFAEGSLDCIVSLLALQGSNDLPGALVQMRRALKPDGLLLAALFAGETLAELRQAWLAAESARGATPRVAPMADLRSLGALLQRAGFALPVADIDRTILRYPSALALMREIKALGFSNPLRERSRRLVSPGLLAEAAALYPVQAGGRIAATVDIAWLTAWTPHESQQKPLRPGSARSRLADALGVPETTVKP